MLGATPSPCPTVTGDVPEALAVTTENPEVVFALTVEVMLPAVLVTPAPLAFQFHATIPDDVSFTALAVPTPNPSESNDVRPLANEVSAAVELDARYKPVPRMTSYKR